MLTVFLLLASGVSYGLLYYIEIHQRLTTEEIKLEILSSHRLLQKKINGCLSGFQRHQLTSRTKISRGCKAILAAQITVMGNMKAHCLDRRIDRCFGIDSIRISAEKHFVMVKL